MSDVIPIPEHLEGEIEVEYDDQGYGPVVVTIYLSGTKVDREKMVRFLFGAISPQVPSVLA